MSTRSDPPDLAVDELRRRARRRLLGAIVLALAAAVIVPMLLESDPKPLGDDVSIQIPPIDNTKFVNPLSPDKDADTKAKAEAGEQSKGKPAPPASAIAVPSQPNISVAPAQTGQPAAEQEKPQTSVAKPSPDRAEPNSAAAPEPGAQRKNSTVSTAKAEPTTEARPTSASEPGHEPAKSTSQGFVIQVAAFADASAARDLAGKLKSAGFPVYTEPLTTSQGTMQRVRVGPYSSRDAADAALARLKVAGYSGIVAAAK